MGILGKKGIPAFLAASLMVSAGVFPVVAAAETPKQSAKTVNQASAVEKTNISKEQAIEIAKKAFPIPKDFTQQNVEFQSNWWGNGVPAWIIQWDRQNPPNYGHFQIVVDAATGSVLNIDMYDSSNQKASYPPKVDMTKAKDIALDFIQKHFPDQSQSIVYDTRFEQSTKPPLSGFVEYPIFFKRTVNGIPFEGNEIRVNVNGEGKIVNFGYRWDDRLQFPVAEKVLSKEQIENIYANRLQPSLRLISQWGPNTERKVNLAYMPQGLNQYDLGYLRATDGAMISVWGDPVQSNDNGLEQIADQKLGDLSKEANLSQEQALEIIKKHFSLPEDINQIRASYREQWGDSKTSVWEFNWESKQNGIAAGWSMGAVDAKTGRVLNYNNEYRVYMEKEAVTSPEKEKAKLSEQEAEKKATELLKKLHPDIAHQIYKIKGPMAPYQVDNNRIYTFSFLRQVNGVSLEYGGINVNIDGVTGEVTNYWFDLGNLNIPDKLPEVVGPELAKKKIMDRTDLYLTYIIPQSKQIGIMNTAASQSKPILVYQPRMKETGEPVYLDATTGKWTNRETGKPITDVQMIVDIKGHPAEKELTLLSKYNVFEPKDNQIFPNELISRGEMIRMLSLIENNGYPIWIDPGRAATFKDVQKESPYFGFIENAVERNWIDRDDVLGPEEKINREELADLLVRALGYQKLVEVPDLFKNDLEDSADIKNVGSAILVTKLGIMDVREGKFEPQGNVSRADAAVAFYQYLGKRNQIR